MGRKRRIAVRQKLARVRFGKGMGVRLKRRHNLSTTGRELAGVMIVRRREGGRDRTCPKRARSCKDSEFRLSLCLSLSFMLASRALASFSHRSHWASCRVRGQTKQARAFAWV